MKTILLNSLMILSIIGTCAYAHEGHDKTPGAVSAPHGGVIQGTHQLHWELVNDPSGIRLYPLTLDLAPIPLKDVALSGNVQFPKKAKKVAVIFTAEDDHYVAKVEANGAYRYTLELSSIYKGKKEKLKFQVEPQS